MSTTDEEFKGNCCMCGEHADAFWMANPSIYVCYSCAVTKLPLLIGDAAVGRLKIADGAMMEGISNQVAGAFWRGVALQLLNQRRKSRTEATA